MLQLIGFDGDDTLWHSEDYYQQANAAFAAIVGRYVDLADGRVQSDMLATERRNLELFGYGAKGMTLSMVETAIAMTDQRISASDIHRIVELGKTVLQHPVELLPGMREAVEQVAADYAVVLITKGRSVSSGKEGGAVPAWPICFSVSRSCRKKMPGPIAACSTSSLCRPAQFAMVGNSLRSDIEPVVRLGGWGVHLPYHVTWGARAGNRVG